ncbi:MAG TPA: membrane protein insertase YidC [Syntrophales bacterium]|nr:membrane protein insertase YidC [Syntrophales bacterium]HOM07504.1 membrane protein insertase YidC [Syntrophales bacterium]HON99831.1 membrane protein insertase YidC [Syntrophales bacterium]HPC01452.1 membrane protein insertase YidC [Syntrophales bacterium]HPQ07151.1 membrane protein insertase YidC [Syntrophales bacterium]
MDKRTILAIVLSMMVIIIYQVFFLKPPPKQPPPQGKVQEAVKEATPPATAVQTPVKASAPAGAVKVQTPAAVQTVAPEREVVVETPLYRAVFTTRGGALKSLVLKHYRKTLAENSDPVEMVDIPAGMPHPLQVSFPASSVDVPPGLPFETKTRALNLAADADKAALTFTGVVPGVMEIEKVFTFHPSQYVFELEVRLRNLSETPLNQNLSLNWFHFADPKAETDSYANEGPVVHLNKDMERFQAKKVETEKVLGPGVLWGGYENKYFIVAMIPQNPSLTTTVLAKDQANLVSVGLRGAKSIIPPAQTGTFSYSLFIGPKDYTILKAQGLKLEEAIDFGSWLKWLAIPLLVALKFLYGYVHNYGLAIIILTIIIKIIFWPLGNKSYESMKEMQKIQPKIQELREKYKNDRQRLSQETMALYRAHKVNPMGGCLPMLIQIPVFFGLYKTLLYAIELRHSPFIWWIRDLSDKDPYYITPIVMGGTMWLQQKMTPTGGDPMQQKVMLWMPVIFTFLFLNFPSGLVIYWLFNNIISIGQQYYINKRYN